MFVSKHNIFILLTILYTNVSIQPEYYLGYENDDEVEDNNETESRRTKELNQQSLRINISEYSSLYDSENEEYDSIFTPVASTTETKKTSVKRITLNSLILTRTFKPTEVTQRLRSIQTVNRSTKLNIFQEYEYVYHDEFTTVSEPTKISNVTPKVYLANITATESKDSFPNISTWYLADFYNLAPAINEIKFNRSTFKYSPRNKSSWYVPEKFPCWESLPIIYGKLGRQRSDVSDVFRVYNSELTDVVDVDANDSLQQLNNMYSQFSHQIINKWCAEAPCFGDHSLCLFADAGKHNSRMCDKYFHVVTPTLMEQTALVNTINSMRNRIASGNCKVYANLPPAANMHQIIYDYDLEDMAMAWLRQCLPGADPCSSLDENYVTQLECTKCAKFCCPRHKENCIPKYECFIHPVIGCLHAWFSSAKKKLTRTDVECGHGSPDTFHAVQLLWAATKKIGCAYGMKANKNVRVVCNFAPGAKFYLANSYHCGLIAHKDITETFGTNGTEDVTDYKFLADLGINMQKMWSHSMLNEPNPYNSHNNANIQEQFRPKLMRSSDLDELNKMYEPGVARKVLGDFSNGSMGMIARLVTRYSFVEAGQSKCDTDEPIYVVGNPGSMCIQRDSVFNNLCYDFADSTPGYRLIAILAPIVLFALILYDLFSGVMRQTNY